MAMDSLHHEGSLSHLPVPGEQEEGRGCTQLLLASSNLEAKRAASSTPLPL